MTAATERYLLSGASGLVGSAIGDAVRVAGAEVLRLVRHPAIESNELQWNPIAQNPIPSPQRLEGMDAAIHLSGANVAARRWTPAYRREMWVSRVDSTESLARALATLERPPRVLLVASATGIYGNRGDEELDERVPAGTGFLADLCRAWEQAAQPAASAGIRVVHLRFGVVIARGGALARMLPIFRLGIGGRLGSGRQWMSWIAMPDLVAAVRFLLQTPDLAGPVNVVAPQPVTNTKFTRSLARQLHRPAILPAPTFALRMALGQMADEALLASQRALPARLVGAGFQFVHPTLDQALAAVLGESETPAK